MAYENKIVLDGVEVVLLEHGRGMHSGSLIAMHIGDPFGGAMRFELDHTGLVRLATVLLDAATEINPDNRRENG